MSLSFLDKKQGIYTQLAREMGIDLATYILKYVKVIQLTVHLGACSKIK